MRYIRNFIVLMVFVLAVTPGHGELPENPNDLNTNGLYTTDQIEVFSELWAFIYLPEMGLFPLGDLVNEGSSGWMAFTSFGLPISSFEPVSMVTINPTRTNLGLVVLMPAETCIGDFDGDGLVNAGDIMLFSQAYVSGDLSADLTGDGEVNIWDQIFFLQLVSVGCITY